MGVAATLPVLPTASAEGRVEHRKFNQMAPLGIFCLIFPVQLDILEKSVPSDHEKRAGAGRWSGFVFLKIIQHNNRRICVEKLLQNLPVLLIGTYYSITIKDRQVLYQF